MADILNYARTTVSNYWYSGSSAIQFDQHAAAMSQALQSALMGLSHSTVFKPPKLIVVGTQSSGKSSLLNALIGIDLLPVGETMTTRAAIQIQLIFKKDETKVEFGSYSNGEWSTSQTFHINSTPTPEQQAMLKDQIVCQTIAKTGSSKGIVANDPISIRLYSPNVPNISFVDLPGLTMTALTSEGQPANLCEQIRELITSYVDERTIILMVCAARADLETDAAMELCKRLTNGDRTIGCLTKTDLCESPDGIVAYLKNTQSVDLRLEHGYFAVKCRSASKDENMQSRYIAEKQYFASHSRYRTLNDTSRIGIANLATFTYKLFIEQIKTSLPQLKTELMIMRDDARTQFVEKLGTSIPMTPASRLTYVSDLISKFCNDINATLTARRPNTSSGRLIRQTFAKLRENARTVTPFTADKFTDNEIMTAVRNCEGWSMVSPVPPVEIVEFFLQHPDQRPIQKLLEPCLSALKNVYDHVLHDCTVLLDNLDRYANLVEWLTTELHVILKEEQTDATRQITHAVSVEEAYIFTDNATFVKEWMMTTQKNTSSTSYPSTLRSILAAYYAVVSESIASYVPKVIVHTITRMLSTMHTRLAQKLCNVGDIDHLLLETEETETLRLKLTNTISTAETCLKTIDNVLT